MKKRLSMFLVVFVVGASLAHFGLAVSAEGSRWVVLKEFDEDLVVYATLSNQDESLAYNIRTLDDIESIKLPVAGGGFRVLKDAGSGEYSPDGNYFSFIKNGEQTLYIYDRKNKPFSKFHLADDFAWYAWSYDSKAIYVDYSIAYDEEHWEDIITRIDVKTGRTEELLRNNLHSFPVTTREPNTLYLRQLSDPTNSASGSFITKYNLTTKEFTPLPPLPSVIDWFWDSYTISPDGSTMIIGNLNYLYVISVSDGRIIDKVEFPRHLDIIAGYSWREDGSYVIFSLGLGQNIIKYTLPKN